MSPLYLLFTQGGAADGPGTRTRTGYAAKPGPAAVSRSLLLGGDDHRRWVSRSPDWQYRYQSCGSQYRVLTVGGSADCFVGAGCKRSSMGLKMAQHRQASSHIKAEPGHDSVRAISFLYSH